MTTARLMPDPDKRYRLITRSDMDGLVCGILLKELDLIDDIVFAHPKDMQDGLIEVGPDDLTANLPFVPGVFLAFDHHASEVIRADETRDNHIIDQNAPSAARVVYDYFGGRAAFPKISDTMMTAVDKADSAGFTAEDILDPQGWALLSFIMDARTGLGRFRDFTISNYRLMMELIDYCRDHQDIGDILSLPDVNERVVLYLDHHTRHREMIARCAQQNRNLVTLDLRHEETIWAGNRFLVYALFPDCNISIYQIWGKNRQNTVFAIGKSILNRSSDIDIGALCLEFGGGGHRNAGTCQVDNDNAAAVLETLTSKMTSPA